MTGNEESGNPPEPESADPDADLLDAVRAGDRRALDELLRRHQPRLWAVCRRLTGSDADADDAAQDALVSIVRALPRFDGRSRFGTWAYRIAVNSSLDELRRRRRRPEPGLPGDADLDRSPEPLAGAGGDSPRGGPVGAGTSPVPDPEGVAVAVDIDAALRRLPPEFRAPVVLRDLCGLDYAEIAEVLALPPGTVRSRISRGRAALAPLLAPGPERPSRADESGPERPLGADSPGPERPPAADNTGAQPPPGADDPGPERRSGADSPGPERPPGAADTRPERPPGAGDTRPERPPGSDGTSPDGLDRPVRAVRPPGNPISPSQRPTSRP